MGFVRSASALALGLAVSSFALAADEAQVKRGEYLARAADCMACHTAEGGAPYAGGLPIHSPFGTIYGSNITPDKQYGIGNYSADEFFAAVTEGKRKDGANLYPAMPYTSYHLIKREDSDAILAYLMTIPPINRPAPQTALRFPFNVRMGLSGWNMLYGKSVQLQPTEGKSPAWQRGQYMVEVMGHCGECHTPRDALGGLKPDLWLAGAPNPEGQGTIPNITPGSKAIGEWSEADIANYLETGFTPDFDSAGGSMTEVQQNVAHLPKADLEAIAAYLKAVPAH